ncbi:glutathione S-transferase family protein [Paraneptunicella aestuarii]|uniref:glutathione S-transferase family protein n=1 Tax=Paraneptunicella aestuarii TaxID=2831148 RepID=UPI001E387ADA|nr:glutathione S-transferase family protein [Paraneptunicella aestuarii]UAA38707.1 glutathione S-transferase family protein [Paraneptunicella aestuarii]
MKYQVYGDMLSGNCYKIKLLLQWLGIEHEWIHVDVLTRETHTEAFLALNPNAKIPVLVIEDETGKKEVLTESNAILNYLAEGTPYLSDSGLARARVLQWQFFEQYSHEPYIAVARFINKYQCLPKEREEEYYSKQEGGHKALKVMEKQLAAAPFFIGDNPTIADISLYAYTHVAHEGGFDLTPYPHIQAWLKRVEQVPGYVSME